jgi:hypothetical protein
MTSQWRDIQEWASTGGGEGDLVESETDIQAYVENLVASLGTLLEDTDGVPVTATSRARGAFSDFNDLARYLETGGLTLGDGSGGYAPNPIVYIVKSVLDDDTVIYEVWIDDET